jgi:uncharacterized protein (DUF58 family)
MSERSDGIHPQLAELLGQRASAQRLLLATRRRSSALDAGGRHSRFRGRGVDFQESRQYQPGDDVRSIDWRVTARSGEPHTKVYTEERNRPVQLLLDANPSLFFGSRRALKSVVTARLAALLAWFTILRGDRLGAQLFSGERYRMLPPMAGQRGLMPLLRALLHWYAPAPTGPSNGGLCQALSRLRTSSRRGGLVILISDFAWIEPLLDSELALLRRHHDVLACRIADPLELHLPPAGRYTISDGRHQRLLDVRSRSTRQQQQARLDLQGQRLQQLLRRCAIPLLTLTALDDPVHVLQGAGQTMPPDRP